MSKDPLLTGHNRCAPVVEIRYTKLSIFKATEYGNGSLTNHSAYGALTICNCKQGHYSVTTKRSRLEIMPCLVFSVLRQFKIVKRTRRPGEKTKKL
jgi:hypothetical protein